ncbi:MAG: alpha/beta fold hydrolase [Anaerolineae bacterium]|nr:alpha/beta fold hydrolase [Anaerolineae bacterium]NIN99635.1 alpha/beta fold hydrolase [Anaerolineae bacterium]NIQ82487.1 alpha/beta fold hydrolase [Anaerolineae bacterium]
MPKVNVAGEDIYYVQRLTRASDTSLVFIHGAGGTHRHWAYQVRSLASVNAYALDLPGHGRSGGRSRTSISSYAEFVEDFVGALGLQRVILGGHSMGGAIVQHFALNHTSRAEGLVLASTGARLRVAPEILEGLLSDFDSTVDMLLGYAYAEDAPSHLVELGKREWLANTPEVVHGDFLACDNFDVMERLGEIGCPTLVLCGEDDLLTPAKYARYLEENIPNATLNTVPGAGHMVMLEQPEQVNRAIEEFLQARGA